jgi:hypothetical protein
MLTRQVWTAYVYMPVALCGRFGASEADLEMMSVLISTSISRPDGQSEHKDLAVLCDGARWGELGHPATQRLREEGVRSASTLMHKLGPRYYVPGGNNICM